MTDREVMQMALEALEDACGGRCNAENNPCWQRDVADALREALEQPHMLPPPPECQTEAEKTAYAFGWWKALETKRMEQSQQEPVAWQWLTTAHFRKNLPKDAEPGAWTPLYAASPCQEWQVLTDEDIQEVRENCGITHHAIKTIEAKLQEKNR